MASEYRTAGKTTVTMDVLLTIAHETTLGVEGVKSFATAPASVERMFHSHKDGVRMLIEDNVVLMDLFLILDSDVNIRDVSRTVQRSVTRAILEMTGLEVGCVNVHIEDIAF